MSETKPKELAWDDEITITDRGYILLEEGDYTFVVKNFEKTRHNGSAKIPACNKAIITLSIDDPDQGTASIHVNLFVQEKWFWKITEFFRAIEQLNGKDGEKFLPRWDEVIGKKGRAHIVVYEYTKNDGSVGRANDVSKFLPYDPDLFPDSDNWIAEASSAEEINVSEDNVSEDDDIPEWKKGKF